MDDDSVHISDSEEAKASVTRLLKAIEGWASKESQKNELEMTAFGAALASGIISFHDFTSKDCRNCKQLVGAIARVKQHLEKEHKKFDSEIDKMHMQLIRLIDQVRMLDQDMIRLQQKVNVVLEYRERQKFLEEESLAGKKEHEKIEG